MPGTLRPLSFAFVPGSQIRGVLEGQESTVVDLVRSAYLLHDNGSTVNPQSMFLQFPDRPRNRIIALPASVGGGEGVDGIKWVSSVPGNTAEGIARASAVVILNDPETGFPYACLEGSVISAARTAASAALAAGQLSAGRSLPRRLGIIGAGLIARYIYAFLVQTGWTFDFVVIADLDPAAAGRFAQQIRDSGAAARVHTVASATDAVRISDLAVFATVAAQPHVFDPSAFQHAPVVLHVSLRDLSPQIILGAQNIVDDVDHALRARTSVHLAEIDSGNRDFVDGTLADVLTGRIRPDPTRPVIFSPFGLGVLDLVLARHVHQLLSQSEDLQCVPGFFDGLDLYGTG